MTVTIREHPISASTLETYGTVSIAFEVRSVLALESANLGGIGLVERPETSPWIKDYDAIRGEGPTRWAKRRDVSGWGMLVAEEDSTPVGGAVIALRTSDAGMLRGREDLAVLWDLRVASDHRGRGIGSRLFEAAVAWAKARGARDLEIETQNINVPACRFYLARGCTLARISRVAYPELPAEIELLWHLPLDRPPEPELRGGAL